MAVAPEQIGIGIRRYFTTDGVDPYSLVSWERRDARISNYRDGSVAFEQLDVEFPVGWSLNATNIVAQKYFRGPLGAPEREWSLKQVADRVVNTITAWGLRDGYFIDEAEARAFADELKYLIVTQRAAFNSPVWFNIGVDGVPQQASACFILAVEDTMDSILNWYVEEGTIFKGGSGAGINLSRIRSSVEPLKGGGTASGPVSFMRGADASAGTIKSGGKTRRAAKMVILNADHPDVEEFVWCKAVEERKARVLRDNGFDMDLDGSDSHSIQYQNANNSVRVTDEFMQAVLDDDDWALKSVITGEVVKVVKARHLMRQISQAAWECADPGMQFDTTINRWHTAANTGRINGSNPCSEYMHLDNSACNLASLNLLSFLGADDRFDVDGFRSAVEVVFTAQEILVGNADYPTRPIAENSRKFRQLGIGYANLGALLMALGLPYDSDGGRALAASITALMTGHAYLTSARTAARMGPFAGYTENREHMLRVLDQHRAAAADIDEELVPAELLSAAQSAWDTTCELAAEVGVRNSQASVLAPTGTIGLMMDCDTTGIEPDLGLSKFKKLVGGGTMSIVNQTVPRALRRLGYQPNEVDAIIAYIDEHKSIIGAPFIKASDLPVFACSMGDNVIHHLGHVRMMGAVQPFISGAISKTVNMPEEVTVEEVEQLHIDAWKLGVKAVAIYRDNCKVAQPLATAKKESATEDAAAAVLAPVEKIIEKIIHKPVREKLPRSRRSRTFDFRVADCKGFVTVAEYEDGRPGELFIRVSKQGSTLAGIMDAFAIAVSYGWQYGVPLRAFVDAFTGMRFEPAGMTDDPDIRIATSLMDYL
ncbi:MAG: vitamin B12-dependent ribonucleotide reductase, partial [Acidimicrobiia bacterium]